MGSHRQDDSCPPPTPPGPLPPRPALSKFKTKYKTSNKPQASYPLVWAHTWEFGEPLERGCPGAAPSGLWISSSLLWGSVLCLGGLHFGGGLTRLALMQLAPPADLPATRPHAAPHQVPSQPSSENSFCSVSRPLNAGAVVPGPAARAYRVTPPGFIPMQDR